MWTVTVPGWSALLVAGALLLYSSLDVAYFARMMFTVARARYFRKKVSLLDTTEVECWCLLNDIDTLLYHMNNARYLRELDFARADFYERTGLYASIKAAGGAVVQQASTIRYRRYLKPFTKFTITSKAIYWDDKTVFMEHHFVGDGGFVHAVAVCRQRVISVSASAAATALLSAQPQSGYLEPPTKMPQEAIYWDDKTVFMEHHFVGDGGFVHAVAVCRQRVISVSASAAATALLSAQPQSGYLEPPTKMPQELELWVQSNEISSAKLRGALFPETKILSEKIESHPLSCGEVMPIVASE